MSAAEDNTKERPINDFGLTEVFCAPDPLVDVVFVHGLNGHPSKSWTTHTTPPIFWPRDLLPYDVDQERCRVLVYGYDANVSTFRDGASKDHIHQHAETLAARLAANRSRQRAKERPLIFVCHSLGGLVVKRMLLYSEEANHPNQERIRSIYVSTFGILFLGTPHLGSDLAKWGSLLQSICAAVLPKKVFDSSSQLVKALETNNETLQVINRQFTQVMPKFRIYFFHEGKPMDLKGTRQFIVDEDSAAPDLPGVERAGIEKDHSNMCKFEDENAPGYDLVSEAIQRYAADAPQKIVLRWEAERKNQDLQKQFGVRELLGDDLPNIVDTSQRAGANTAFSDTAVSTKTNSAQVSRGNSIDNSAASSRLLEAASSRSSNGPPLVAPLGFRPNSIFKGFELELDWMDRKLKSDKKTELGTSAILLSGPPGCGKSHLARQYVWLHRTEHPAGTFWVDCKSVESIVSGYFDIGRKIGCLNESNSSHLTPDDPFIDAVRTTLQEQHGWILVFDGILFQRDEDIDSFIRFLPDSQGNEIIFTSVDRMLARRQRLLVPSGLPIRPLQKRAALSLLYSLLRIRHPTSAQKEKAFELVRHYNYLPLGIHAAAHALDARGRRLERFTPLPSDNRLAQPFQDILNSLVEHHFDEAFNLIRLLSFVYHRVPVAMVQFGAKYLRENGCEAESADPNGGIKRHLDNSIAILISRGLIERQLQPLNTSSDQEESSPELSRRSTTNYDTYMPDAYAIMPAPLSQDPSGLEQKPRLDDLTESDSLKSVPAGIDTIKTHTVVQSVIRDGMKIDPKEYYQWLVRACYFLQASYNGARARNKYFSGHGLITDLHEYKTHGEALHRHFPSSADNVPRWLFDARHDLRSLLRSIDEEIQTQSPSSSTTNSSSHRPFRSVFERSASSSDEGPETPKRHALSRSTTWSLSAINRRTTSPIDIRHPELPLEEDPDIFDDDAASGYMADYDEVAHPDASRQWSLKSGQTALSDQTHQSALPSVLEQVLHGIPPGKRKDLGEYKRLPTVGPVRQENAVSMPSPPPPSKRPSWWSLPFGMRRTSSQSLAEESLTALRDARRPIDQSADVVDSPIEDISRPGDFKRPLGQGSPNASATALSGPRSLASKSAQLLQQGRAVSSSPKSSPKLLSAVLNSEARNLANNNAMLPIEENITITRRIPAGVNINIQPMPVTVTSPIGPAAGSPLPEGYSSALDMSREPSNESRMSIVSLPILPTSMAGTPIPEYVGTSYTVQRHLPSIDASIRGPATLFSSAVPVGGFGMVRNRSSAPGQAPYPTGDEDDLGYSIDIGDDPRDPHHRPSNASANIPMPSPSAFNHPVGLALSGFKDSAVIDSDDSLGSGSRITKGKTTLRPRAQSRA